MPDSLPAGTTAAAVVLVGATVSEDAGALGFVVSVGLVVGGLVVSVVLLDFVPQRNQWSMSAGVPLL